MKNIIVVLVILFLILLGAWYFYNKPKDLVAPTYTPYTQDEPTEWDNGCGAGVTDCKG